MQIAAYFARPTKRKLRAHTRKVCVSVCSCHRERQREREREKLGQIFALVWLSYIKLIMSARNDGDVDDDDE